MTEQKSADQSFEVDRTDLSSTQFLEIPDLDSLVLNEKQAVITVDKFALTANNITYGVAGDMIGYWNFFPASERDSVLHVLSRQLVAVICQKLLPGVDGDPVLIVEYFQNEGAAGDWIRKGEFLKIADFVARGGSPDARGFLDGIVEAVKAGRISEETGETYSGNAVEFQRAMRGISSGS